MNYKINVIIKEPGKKARKTSISNSLENLQKWVGGYIETYTRGVWVDGELVPIVVICNEEGRLKNLEPNCVFMGNAFVGTIILCGQDEYGELGEFPLPYQKAKELWPFLWEEEK